MVTKSTKKEPSAEQGSTTESSRRRGSSRVKEGIVVSDSMSKTIVVAITRAVRHPVYKKYVKKTNKIYAHDEQEQAGIGDLVRVAETRPLSRLKRWKLKEIVRVAE